MANSSLPTASETEIEDALQQRDALIEKLTAQLEQTADQLDRLRRSGADRIHGGPKGSAPRLDQELIERLEKMLSDWEESQPHEMLQRIEQSLERGVPVSASTPHSARNTSDRATTTPASTTASSIEPSRESEKGGSAPEDDFWSKARARILGLDTSEPADKPTPPVPPSRAMDTGSHPTSGANSENSDPEPMEEEEPKPAAEIPKLTLDVDLPEKLPRPVSLDANRDDLMEAVDARDEYIVYLTSRVRELQLQVIPTIDWEVVNQCPDDLRMTVQRISNHLERQLREAELSMSLERANLGRERAKLMKVKEFLEQQVKRLNNQSGGDGQDSGSGQSSEKSASEKKADMDRRWGRFFTKDK